MTHPPSTRKGAKSLARSHTRPSRPRKHEKTCKKEAVGGGDCHQPAVGTIKTCPHVSHVPVPAHQPAHTPQPRPRTTSRAASTHACVTSSSGCAEPCRVAGLRGRTALMVPSRLLKYRRVRQGAQAMACSAPSCSSSSLRPRRARPRSWSCAPPPRHPPRPPPAHELSPCRAPARRVRSRQDVVDDMRRGGEGAARAQGRCVVTPGRRL